MAKHRIPQDIQAWMDARNRHHLSDAHVQMARELGLNPKHLGKIDNHGQEAWKDPLPVFLERIYLKRFGRSRPETVRSLEETMRYREAKDAEKRARRLARKAGLDAGPPPF